MERKTSEAMESFFKSVGVPVLKTQKLKGGEYIYGSNLFIPALKQSFDNIARGINILQHLRCAGENVPMNIWVCESIDHFNFVTPEWYKGDGVCPNLRIYRYKSYFYKDIVNQDITETTSIKNYLINSEYDVDDGTFFTTCMMTDTEKIKEEIKQKTRFFKVKVDNGCLERWMNRYMNEIGEFDGFDVDSFIEELKNPVVLKDYIEPVKEIPSKLLCMVKHVKQTPKIQQEKQDKPIEEKKYEVILFETNCGIIKIRIKDNSTTLAKLIESEDNNDMAKKLSSFSFKTMNEAKTAEQLFKAFKDVRGRRKDYSDVETFERVCPIANTANLSNDVEINNYVNWWKMKIKHDELDCLINGASSGLKSFYNANAQYLCTKKGQELIEEKAKPARKAYKEPYLIKDETIQEAWERDNAIAQEKQTTLNGIG